MVLFPARVGGAVPQAPIAVCLGSDYFLAAAAF